MTNDAIAATACVVLFISSLIAAVALYNQPKKTPLALPPSPPRLARKRTRTKRACGKHIRLLPIGAITLLDSNNCDYCKGLIK